MSDTENQLPIRIVLQLQEARIGDRNRLESIKESLSAGKELSETEKKYLEEKSAQLQMAIDHHTMVDWAMNFVRKLQEKEKKKNLTLSELKNSLEKEKKAYKIDKKFLEQTSSRLKQEVEQQKKTKETLDLISQLKQEKIGEDNKLDRISGLLRSRKPVDDIDRQYITEKERAFKKLVEYKTKVTRSIDATKKLQEADIKHSKKLDAIRHALEQKKPISSQETAYINARYEKLQRVLDEEHRIEWTKRAIEKLLQSGRGDAARFDSIMHLLEEEIPVPESEIKYLKEQYKVVLLIQQ